MTAETQFDIACVYSSAKNAFGREILVKDTDSNDSKPEKIVSSINDDKELSHEPRNVDIIEDSLIEKELKVNVGSLLGKLQNSLKNYITSNSETNKLEGSGENLETSTLSEIDPGSGSGDF